MTDKPTTLALNARQWRVLMNDHLDVLKAGVATAETLDEAGLKNVVHHLEQIRLMAGAWFQNSPQTGADAPKKLDIPKELEVESVRYVAANGAEAPKRGGWPKGKPRKQRMNPAQVQ